MEKNTEMKNLFQLDGRVPVLKAIPFGLQHILAMFVANLTPITLIGVASGLSQDQIAFFVTKCDVCGRYRNFSATLSRMESRF